jgi:TPR repeat protein
MRLALGNGLPKNPVLAYAWYDLAARGGYEEAVAALQRLGQALTTAQLEQAKRFSEDWKPGVIIPE